MKNLLIFLVFILFASNCVSQDRNYKTDIIGVWQLGSSEISSAYLDNYSFFPHGEFIFNVNEYDELKQVVAIKGTYTVYPDSINFKPNSIITHDQVKTLERSMFTSVHDSWSIDWKTYNKETILENPEEFSATLEFKKTDDNKVYILIDGNKYYMINKNPEK